MRVFLVAGEVSGDKLGGALMAGLRVLAPDVTFVGVGGPLMAAQGLSSMFPMDELSVMGLAEIVPKYRALKRRVNETARAVIDQQPDVLITIDSPDFCLRVAKLVKAACDVPTMHYVAPSVWAWRAGRARKMARYIDHVLALLPFEPPLMRAAGMTCDFVGHPVVGEPRADAGEIAAFRQQYDLGDHPVLVVLPGSRRGEIDMLADRFGETLRRVLAVRPDVRIVVPAAAPIVDMLRARIADWPSGVILLDPTGCDVEEFARLKRAAFGAADVALAASGTVSLELAAAETPMVIGYDVKWLSRQIMARMIKIDTLTLVNLVSETREVREFIGAKCAPQPMAEALLDILDAPGAQIRAMQITMERLGRGGEAPGLRAAKAVLSRL